MTPSTLLRLAGPGARLVARPRGVLHAYVGPLTRSGAAIPRARRSACRARTGRLYVVELERASASAQAAGDQGGRRPPVCARCSACLSRPGSLGRQAGRPVRRDDVIAARTGLSLYDLARQVMAAVDETDVDHVAHLSLALFGLQACTRALTSPAGVEIGSIQDLISRHRSRVHIPTDAETRDREKWDMALVNGLARGKAERQALAQRRRDQLIHGPIPLPTRQS